MLILLIIKLLVEEIKFLLPMCQISLQSVDVLEGMRQVFSETLQLFTGLHAQVGFVQGIKLTHQIIDLSPTIK